MKKKSLIALLLLSILFIATPSEAGKGSANLTQLVHLKLLADLSQDLDDQTTVLVQLNKRDDSLSCVCACRENTWSCTTTECGMQNKECENKNWDEEETDLQANAQLKAFSMVDEQDNTN